VIETTTLPNGLRIITENMPGFASATIGIWVQAGGRHERAEENGIAHFLEHMAFKGTKTRSALRIAEEIEDVGGYINAYTSREMTAYYARVLGADVGLALDVISDIVLNPVFDPREIEVERHVILQEIGQRSGKRWIHPTISSSTGCKRRPIPIRRWAVRSSGPPSGWQRSVAKISQASLRAIMVPIR